MDAVVKKPDYATHVALSVKNKVIGVAVTVLNSCMMRCASLSVAYVAWYPWIGHIHGYIWYP